MKVEAYHAIPTSHPMKKSCIQTNRKEIKYSSFGSASWKIQHASKLTTFPKILSTCTHDESFHTHNSLRNAHRQPSHSSGEDTAGTSSKGQMNSERTTNAAPGSSKSVKRQARQPAREALQTQKPSLYLKIDVFYFWGNFSISGA